MSINKFYEFAPKVDFLTGQWSEDNANKCLHYLQVWRKKRPDLDKGAVNWKKFMIENKKNVERTVK